MSGNVQYLNPEGLVRSPVFTQVVAVSGPVRTIYVGGQNGVDESGKIVARDVEGQTEQVFRNLETALAAAGAGLTDIVKWDIHVVAGHSLESGVQVFARVWGNRPNPPAITVSIVSGLADPDFLVELDAVAVVAE